MTAPFRDLFVELPATVFESLQQFGEALLAREQAAQPARAVKPPSVVEAYVRWTMQRYGWRRVETRRIEHGATTHVIAQLNCGHGQRYEVDEIRLARCRGISEEIDLLDRIVAETPRRCYCVQRSPEMTEP